MGKQITWFWRGGLVVLAFITRAAICGPIWNLYIRERHLNISNLLRVLGLHKSGGLCNIDHLVVKDFVGMNLSTQALRSRTGAWSQNAVIINSTI